MIHPWQIPASAWLDPRWNAALDLAAEVPISPVKVAAAWDRNGPDQVLSMLRVMAARGEAVESAARGEVGLWA